eukprot:CAMPEP_0116148872 /NCGR_PEP_ID=MMETSP0329-20121206/18615_1 /TAXON_ID=697910 /ORGANISM="Pseudo-nitzschia arenysensis, Strain B593" /LENGTH=388 /DNA_ID=CAMNT_0003645087 /DNA_START=102 /DNA_END=1268 /DNA_ORIENTATION=+
MDYENVYYADASPSSDSDYTMSEEQKRGMALFFFVTTLSVIFVSICSAKHIFQSCCCRAQRSCIKYLCGECQDGRDEEQYAEDRVFAESLQRRINEEERQRDRLLKRKERRMWYEYYMKPWTMVVEKSDLFHTNPEADVEANMMEMDSKQASKDSDGGPLDSDAEEVSEDTDKLQIPQCRVCDEEDENATLHLRLPKTRSCVDGTCAFCLDEYEAGDEVVWSDLECPHVFHKECLMLWLSKGKKRCPICRHWFVPGSKIDDQKHLHGEAWQRALLEMQKAEKEENEKSNSEEQNTTEPENDLEQGIVEINSTVPSSQSTVARITSESAHSRSEHDGRSATCEVNDIESQGIVPTDERSVAAHDGLCEKESKRERQHSNKSEVECVFGG